MATRRIRRILQHSLVLALLAAAVPTAALAHANLVRLTPLDGSSVARAPAEVRVLFDDPVEVGSRNRAIRNGGGSVLRGRPFVSPSNSRLLVLPLARDLRRGDYSVRWSVVSDDGHPEAGVLSFSVGTGRAPAGSVLEAGAAGGAQDAFARWLLLAGVLVAGGTAVFAAAVARPAAREAGLADPVGRELALVLFVSTLVAFLGAFGLAHAATGGTRFAHVVDAAAVVAAVAATLAALALYERWARVPAALAALVLVPLPTLAGHALDGDQPWWSVPADLVHVLGAAVWLGGLVALAVAVPRAARTLEPGERGRLFAAGARRFSTIAVGAVAAVALTGLLRAFRELSAVSQLWETGYGRALIVKTALFAPLLALGWHNRARLVPRLAVAARSNPAGPRAFRRLRGNLVAELAALAGIVVAVAVLTQLRPGKGATEPARAAVAPRPVARRPALPPPSGGLVLARQSVDLAVGLSIRPGRGRLALTSTILSPTGFGLEGIRVSFGLDGRAPVAAPPCGPGCYSASLPLRGRPKVVRVRLEGLEKRGRSSVEFRLPRDFPAPRADALLVRTNRALKALRSMVIDEQLESSPQNRILTRFQEVAPDRLTYRIQGGAQAVIVGPRRWDRAPGGEWRESPQSPLELPALPWGPRVRDVYLLGEGRERGRPVWILSFVDPQFLGWFEARVDRRTYRPLDIRMTAAAHFMRDSYSGFNAPLKIVPPK